jgi:DNA-binding MarR family transcriptional regulator
VSTQSRDLQRTFKTVSLGAPENAVGFVLWRIVQRYQREMDRALAPLDLTNLQFVTLALAAWFARTGDTANQAALARYGGIHPMQVSHMLKTLEQKGFITRKVSRQDTRAKEIAVTQAGLAALEQAFPAAVRVQRRLFGKEGRQGGTLLTSLTALDTRLGQTVEE